MVSSCFSLVVLSILLMLPFFLLDILGVPPHKLQQRQYKAKYGEIFLNTHRPKSYSRGLFYPLFLLHRYFCVFIVFTASQSGVGQVCLMVLATSLFFYYLLQWKPFPSKIDFALNLFNTLVLILLYLFCLVFSISSAKSSFSLGFAFIFIVLFLFLLNVAVILLSKICSCVLECRRRKQRHREREKFHFDSEMPALR